MGWSRGWLYGERAIALILTLWVMALLSVIAMELSYSVRTEAQVTFNYMEEVKAYFLARAGIHYSLYRLSGEIERGIELKHTFTYSGELGEGSFVVQGMDEAGKIDLNLAPLDLLREVWRKVGLNEEASEKLLEFLEERRGSIISPEEILGVRGLTKEVFYQRLFPILTVYSERETVDPNAAPEEVLEVLPGMDEELAQAVLERREETPFREVGELMPIVGEEVFRKVAPYLKVAEPSDVFSIRSTGRITHSGIEREIMAIVLMTGDGTEPFKIIQWYDKVYKG